MFLIKDPLVQDRQMKLRRSDLAIVFFLAGMGGVLASVSDADRLREHLAPALAMKQALVVELQLTDLCLFTEARYTRHPSQADLHSAFMDHPLAFEHFPSGSLIPPPPSLIRAYESLDRKTEVPD